MSEGFSYSQAFSRNIGWVTEQAQRLIGELVRMSSNLDALRLLKTALGDIDQRDGG